MDHEYIFDYKDFRNAQKLYLRHRKRAGATLRFWLYGLPTMTIVFLAIDIYAFKAGQNSAAGLFGWLTACALWMTLMIVVRRPWNLRRLYKKMLPPGTKDAVSAFFSFGEDGVISGITGRSEGRFFWKAILDYAEDDQIALLFIHQKRFLFIPKWAMDDSEWVRLRDYAGSHIVRL